METIEKGRIDEIATRIAAANLGVGVSSAVSSPTIDSMGRQALEITIVLTPNVSAAITGRVAATTVFDLNQALQKAGEERFPTCGGWPSRAGIMAMVDPDHLFEQADRLITPLPTEPEARQTDLRRAVSAAYYGIFHFTMTAATDTFVGTANRESELYGSTYRTVKT